MEFLVTNTGVAFIFPAAAEEGGLVQQRASFVVKVWVERRFWGERWGRSRRSRMESVKGSSPFFSDESVGIEMNIGGRKLGELARLAVLRPRRSRRRGIPDSGGLPAIVSTRMKDS